MLVIGISYGFNNGNDPFSTSCVLDEFCASDELLNKNDIKTILSKKIDIEVIDEVIVIKNDKIISRFLSDDM